MDTKSERTLAVLDPIKLIFTNIDDNFELKCEQPFMPKDKSLGFKTIYLRKELFVDREDCMI